MKKVFTIELHRISERHWLGKAFEVQEHGSVTGVLVCAIDTVSPQHVLKGLTEMLTERFKEAA